jgi:hypothetical protein
MPTLINKGKFKMTVQDDATSSVNDKRTCQEIGTPLTQPGSPNVLRDLLVRRNLAEQSKWLNDETGDRSWATHENPAGGVDDGRAG